MALAVSALYLALSSLWWYPAGRERAPAEAALESVRPRLTGDLYRRGLPLVALQRYPDLQVELDGRPVPVKGPEAAQRRAFSESLRLKPRPKVDPVVLYGVPSVSVDITRVQPGDGPRPGGWTREDHWVRATWTHPEDGSRQERVWNAAEVFRAFEREVGAGQEPEALFLEMGPPVREGRPTWFAGAAVWLLTAWGVLVVGLCQGLSPRALFGRTLLALALGPVWLLLAWVFQPRIRRLAVMTLLPLLIAGGALAQETRYEAVTAYGAYGTLRLKAQAGEPLEARLEIPAGRGWRPVTAPDTAPEGWKPFVAPPGQRQLIQYLCDLPLAEARKVLPESGPGRRIRVTVRRSGARAWLQGSWQGELIPPPIGIKAWTYWLPSVPPPVQSTAGLVTLMAVLLWIGCIAAVRAEAGRMGLEGAASLWRHAGWLHLPGALLFFATHPPPPVAGIGRELAPPRRKPRA